ncbi:NAD(P)H-dependent oxidoreductase [Sphingomonas naphthae]|uniref:NAD(P)H-dependent oxidoreductase n=1 Tax=Sphingomonas naphthae TaxID=1813468 RepID=A0ABY7TNL1_9SPHN|nr:NADPH-dependent FMN reductase [Sphingomonas naphthae]WCT74794.1 NAD(P)H-dependent oxidoreductase [Sphingomonas naphthae]
MKQVAVLVGSLRRESLNRKLAEALMFLGEGKLAMEIVEIGGLPLYNEDLWADPPEAVTAFKAAIAKADAVLIVTPEYNRSMPAAIKNALDWGSRPMGQSVWPGKKAAMAGASPGAVGTAVAQAALRTTIVTLGMALMGQPELYLSVKDDTFAPDGGIGNEKTAKFLAGFVDKFAAWVG